MDNSDVGLKQEKFKTKSGFELTKHSHEQLLNRFDNKLSLNRLDELLNNENNIRLIDTRTGNINIYTDSEFSTSSLMRITVPQDAKRIVSIGFEQLKRIDKFLESGVF